MNKLITRDDFREGVFKRDHHKCVVCKEPAQDAHHILERRLFPDGGYYLNNGASVCGIHHMEAEQTLLSCDELRRLCGIKEIILPPQYCLEDKLDKWGNYILPNGNRTPGELFYDESVQKILLPVLHLFSSHIKYPRTFHFSWSAGATKDDRLLDNTKSFEGKEVIVTVKMDGENTTMYSDYIHARSINSDNHPSRTWVKALHGRICNDIPKGYRICGENLYAKHSIHYKNLQDYFLVFSIWNDRNICLSWKETKEWTELLGLKTVPVLYEGIWDEKLIKNLYTPNYNGDELEGYVVRLMDSFGYSEFRKCVGKYVRANHVQTDQHWLQQQVIPNKIK